jgi:hypothetical protein
MPTPYTDLVTSTGWINRSAIMRMAAERTRRELARWQRVGLVGPTYREAFAHELSEVWGWAKSIRRGLENGRYRLPREPRPAPMFTAA